MQEPNINFTRWIDPLDSINRIEENSGYDAEEQEHLDFLKKANGNEEQVKQKCIVGPFGVIPIDEYNRFSSLFNVWNYSTNFDLTPQIIDIVKVCEGVEILKIGTRYRGIIGVGKLFEADKVFTDIKTKIKQHFYKKDEFQLVGKQAAVYCLNQTMKRYYDFYTIYATRMGWLFPIVAENKGQLQEYADAYKKNEDEVYNTIEEQLKKETENGG